MFKSKVKFIITITNTQEESLGNFGQVVLPCLVVLGLVHAQDLALGVSYFRHYGDRALQYLLDCMLQLQRREGGHASFKHVQNRNQEHVRHGLADIDFQHLLHSPDDELIVLPSLLVGLLFQLRLLQLPLLFSHYLIKAVGEASSLLSLFKEGCRR